MSDIAPVVIRLSVMFLIPFCVFTLLSLIWNGRKAVQWSDGMMTSVRTNLLLMVVNSVTVPALVVMVAGLQASVSRGDVWRLDPSIWTQVPIWAAIMAVVVIIDLSDYCVHRLLHTKWLWPIHFLHHSDQTMNHTMSFRVHVLEGAIMMVSVMLFGFFLSLPPLMTGAVSFVVVMYNKFVHLDADIHFGPFNKILSSPRLHRWHHAENPASYGKNLANIFSFWDVLFGTYYLPGKCEDRIGFDGAPHNNVLWMMVWPFRMWGEMLRDLRKGVLAR